MPERAEIEAVAAVFGWKPGMVGPAASGILVQAARCIEALDRVRDARGDDERCKFTFDKRELDVLCESLWHSLARADLPDEDIDVMRPLRERLNDARR